jgi:SAM-dependent methyltransferase
MAASPAYEMTACPVCSSSDARELASADEIRNEIEQLWSFHSRRLRPDIPPRHLTDRVAFSQRPPLRVVQCVECTLVYRNPREREIALRDAYEDEKPDEQVLESLFETQLGAYHSQAQRLRRILGRGGSGLEVGSYVGGFLAAARASGMNFEGLDVNEHANAFARSRGYAVTDGDMESWQGGDNFDVVAIWNTFDQLPDPARATRRARELLATGGILALRVPNGEYYARLRQRMRERRSFAAAGLLAHSNLLSFPYRHGFTVRSLERLIERNAFEVIVFEGDALVPIADRWTRPWAAAEERALKLAQRLGARVGVLPPHRAPWLELYARAT